MIRRGGSAPARILGAPYRKETLNVHRLCLERDTRSSLGGVIVIWEIAEVSDDHASSRCPLEKLEEATLIRPIHVRPQHCEHS